MMIFPFSLAGLYVGIYRPNIGLDKPAFATGKTRAEVITKLLNA